MFRAIQMIRCYLGAFYHNIHLREDFGLRNTLYLIYLRYKKIIEPSKADLYEKLKHDFLYDYLKRKYYHYIDKSDVSISCAKSSSIIWVYWWQGESFMPPIVKKCFESITHFANGFKVQLITKENYNQFVEIPSIMLVKQEKKIICKAHFSDIYRCYLLNKHGGLWLDATILVTAPIDKNIFKTDFFSMKKDPSDGHVYNSRYSSFCLGAKANNILFRNLTTLFSKYIRQNKYFIDYFVIDLFIEMICNKIPECANMLDSLEYNNPNQLSIQLNYNEPFNRSLFKEWNTKTSLHKLTYKGKLCKIKNNKETFYGHILNLKLKSN